MILDIIIAKMIQSDLYIPYPASTIIKRNTFVIMFSINTLL